MKKIGNIITFIFIILIGFIVFAADVKVEISVDRNQMGIGDSFTLNVSIQSDSDFETHTPQLQSIPNVEVVEVLQGGRQSSSSMTIINGKTQFIQRTMQDFNFILSPQKEGVYTIPSVEVVVDGRTYKSNSVKIEVGEQFRNSKAQPKGRPRFPPGFGGQNDDDGGKNSQGFFQDDEDLFEQLLRQQQRMFGGGANGGFGRIPPLGQIPSRQLKVNTNEAFFIYIDIDKSEVFEGEQVNAKWYIYTRSNIESLDRVKFPDLKGFWKEIIEEVPALQFTEEIVNGVRFKKALLASHALFPIKPGVAIIDEFRVKAKVRNVSQQGWGSLRELTKSSRRVEVKVLPLPEQGRGKSFSGAVGNYHIILNTDATTYPAHQPFSIKVRFEGVGNAKLIDLPAINWPDGLEVFDTKSESKFFKDGQSYKEFEILVIPRKEGAIKIPQFELTYFDPQIKKYISEITQELNLQITPGVTNENNKGASVSLATNVQENIFEPRSILELPSAGFSISKYRWQLYFLVFVCGVMVLLVNFSIQYSSIKNKPYFFIEVKNKLDLLEKSILANDERKIGSIATNLIYILVANLADQKKADQEIHLLINEISTKDQHQYLNRIMQLFDYFQLIGFSPDEVKDATLRHKPIKNELNKLKILTEEIVAKSRKQDKNNE